MLSCVEELNEDGNLRGWGKVVIIIVIIIIIIIIAIIIRRTQSQYTRRVLVFLRRLLHNQPIDFQAIP